MGTGRSTMQIDDDDIGEKFQFFLNKNRKFASGGRPVP
jgi:hypothetical protein